jgi:outer membrane protein OmpA-like peptidoglycan-associated protein
MTETMPGSVFAQELQRSEAAELARAGDHDSALRILTALNNADPETLDLLAKVHAQCGDLIAAEAAWQRVLVRDPNNAAALAGIQLIAQITAGKRRRRPLPALALGASAAAVVVLAGVVVLITLPRQGDSVASAPPPQAPTVTVMSTVNTNPPVQAADKRLQTLMGELAGRGVRLELQDQEIKVIFDDGLFAPNGSQLTASGRSELTQWGQQLRDKDVRVTVLGHGVAVDGGPQNGGSTVAVARAAAAAQVLAQVSGRPLTSFMVTTADQSAVPHPGDQAKNRTVSLLVAPA